MTVQPMAHQLSGATFLAGRTAALLADEQRTGKTGTSLIAAERIGAKRILVVTTKSGKHVWPEQVRMWAPQRRLVVFKNGDKIPPGDVIVIASWPQVINPRAMAALLGTTFDLLILDEDHLAKNYEAARTRAVYGVPLHGGQALDLKRALCARAHRCWALTGTPLPHDAGDMYPRLRALAPEILLAADGFPDITTFGRFQARHCIIVPKQVSEYRTIDVTVGSKNGAELRARIDRHGFMRRVTQAEIGITQPYYAVRPIELPAADRRMIDNDPRRAEILAAVQQDRLQDLEMHLGTLRRLSGELKAPAIIAEAIDEFETGTFNKIVLVHVHRSVGRLLMAGLKAYGPVELNGSSSDAERSAAIERFTTDRTCRVFVAQIVASGESVDLSAASTMWFCEQSFSPKDQAQMSQRIVNINQRAQPLVEVLVAEGTIDEAIGRALLRLWAGIRQVVF